MYSSTGLIGVSQLGSMASHWISDIITPTSKRRTKEVDEFDIITSWVVDLMFQQYLREYVRQILNGQKTIEMLEIELSAMRTLYAVNWLNVKTDGRMFRVNAHGHSLKTCYDNLNNPMYRHTGHEAAKHKCLWEYYLNQAIH